ncbi:MAG: DUF1501 domain-containing protein [Pirellulales bacterium]|nr:DUF1501 domain-containing protein [Pirellulales bacterium]
MSSFTFPHRRRSGQTASCFCGRVPRRTFLADVGFGVTGLALGTLLWQDGVARANEGGRSPPNGKPHFPPRAKSVIWVFLSGGVSHLETFDPKPALNTYAGKTYEELPRANPQADPRYRERSRSVVGFDRHVYNRIMPLQVGFRPHGQSGIEVSDWLPHLAGCVDDMTIVRSMYTTDNDHNAEFQMHHGRHSLDERQPVIGSWIHYGLGSLNENLPQFVFLGEFKDTRVKQNFSADYLGPRHNGIQLALDPQRPLPFGNRLESMLADEQQHEFEYLHQLNLLSSVEYPDDQQLQARIRAYELAFRMQMSVPEALDLASETQETLSLYGIDDPATEIYGRRLLAARRLAERGVRFTLVYLSDYGEWDSHQDLKNLHARSCRRVDKPLAGLLRDLKRRGLWQETLVVCATEFGRTPAVEDGPFNRAATGRDHHPHGFSIWLAGAGIKQGHVHGCTDELGFHAEEHPHYVTDLHATVLHLLGLDPRRLDIPGRKRLEIDYGTPIWDVLA